MPELLKPRPLHVHGNFISVFVSCVKRQRKGHEIELMAIILHEAQFFTQNMYGKRNLGP